MFTTVLASEMPYLLFTLAGIALWEWRRKALAVRGISAGAMFALAALVRPTALLVPVVMGVSDAVCRREWRRPVAMTALVTAVMLVGVAPWSVRNTRLFDEFVLVSTNGGTNLWIGNNPEANGFYMDIDKTAMAGMNELERDRHLGAEAKAFMREHPAAATKLVVKKLAYLHAWETIGVAWNEPSITKRFGERALRPLKWVGQCYWMALVGAALMGLLFHLKRHGLVKAIAHPITMNWAFYAAVYAVTQVQDRFHFSFVPMLAVLAALPIVWVMDKRSKQRGAA